MLLCHQKRAFAPAPADDTSRLAPLKEGVVWFIALKYELLPEPPAQLDALQLPVRATDCRFEKTVAFAGGVGKADAAAPDVPEGDDGFAVPDELDDGFAVPDEFEDGVELLEVDEPELDAGASVVEAGLFCEEEAAFGLPPQPAKYIDNANTKTNRRSRTATLFTKNLPGSSGVSREYGSSLFHDIGACI